LLALLLALFSSKFQLDVVDFSLVGFTQYPQYLAESGWLYLTQFADLQFKQLQLLGACHMRGRFLVQFIAALLP
jgi:hypothetical protein